MANKQYNQNFKSNYGVFRDKKIIPTIQYLEFLQYLNNNDIKLTTDQVFKITEALKYEGSIARYNYQSLTVIVAFLGILVAAFLGSWLQAKNNSADLINIATKSIALFLILSIFAFLFEEMIIKDFIQAKRNRYQRLIRVLENYSLNLKA